MLVRIFTSWSILVGFEGFWVFFKIAGIAWVTVVGYDRRLSSKGPINIKRADTEVITLSYPYSLVQETNPVNAAEPFVPFDIL